MEGRNGEGPMAARGIKVRGEKESGEELRRARLLEAAEGETGNCR